MPFIFFNPNPSNKRVGDCAVRAVAKAIGQDWKDAYIGLCSEGLVFKDMPSSNYVWGMYLKKYGFEEHMISSICPECVTVAEFAKTHPKGRYVLATQNHVVCVDSGNWYDSWDSGDEVVLYFYKQIIWVQGEAAAKAYPVVSGQSVQLMDSEESVFYIKSTDQSGMPQPLRIFDYKERTSERSTPAAAKNTNDDFVSRKEFEEFREDVKRSIKGLRKEEGEG